MNHDKVHNKGDGKKTRHTKTLNQMTYYIPRHSFLIAEEHNFISECCKLCKQPVQNR